MKFFKTPIGITLLIIVGVVALSFGGVALFKAGQKNALQQELNAVNSQLGNTRASSDSHLKLLAKRTAIQKLLNNI